MRDDIKLIQISKNKYEINYNIPVYTERGDNILNLKSKLKYNKVYKDNRLGISIRSLLYLKEILALKHKIGKLDKDNMLKGVDFVLEDVVIDDKKILIIDKIIISNEILTNYRLNKLNKLGII